MVKMQITLSLVVSLRAVSVGRGDLECFRQQSIHRHSFVVVFCRIYTRVLVVSYDVLHALILTASGFQELSVMVYAIFEIPCILCFL